ncbi:hypothetical protein BV394_04095 [Brevirhabdus pacifica]|uniref:Uncharacterized protein n=2 Tax=Brevirhabdus pacifica TaxID=1267768 RepID=A0A1U7DGK9_9RHOB|nr:sulfotransferase [Brevirhabdus pacifica]APX89008.1 hypothetical protein BV394_04095 [Brevirhabdus pacifica]OWU80223.1 hypothetical protein ATO5_04775 [Loktanella sp. 22II-4b]PJJ86426.1 sulfotransferase family protein [Brevirhabdus pacifica]
MLADRAPSLSATSPRPIFVLGIQRSGTTWVANLLASDPRVAAVTAARHRGVHESLFFSHFARAYGPWSDLAARKRAIAEFVDSDYGRLAGIDALAAAELPRHSPEAFFRGAMDTLAARDGRAAWVEKSPHHTPLAFALARAMPDAHFVCVHRDDLGLVRSRLWAYGRVPARWPRRGAAILRGAGSNNWHRRLMQRLAQTYPDRVTPVLFTDLALNPTDALSPVFRKAGLDAPERLLSAFEANSSFAPGREERADRSRRALTPADRLAIRLAGGLVNAAPGPALAAARMAARAAQSRRRPIFPHWVWSEAEAAGRQAGPVQD